MELFFTGVMFCALGGPYWFYGLSVIFAAVACWRYRRARSTKVWLVGAAFCLAIAVSTHLVMIYVMQDVFVGAITG
jgi:hypothetical protein